MDCYVVATKATVFGRNSFVLINWQLKFVLLF